MISPILLAVVLTASPSPLQNPTSSLFALDVDQCMAHLEQQFADDGMDRLAVK